MIDIVVSKKDEVYAKITCERHIAKELSEFFTFYVPGYQFTPAFKNKIWDIIYPNYSKPFKKDENCNK